MHFSMVEQYGHISVRIYPAFSSGKLAILAGGMPDLFQTNPTLVATPRDADLIICAVSCHCICGGV